MVKIDSNQNPIIQIPLTKSDQMKTVREKHKKLSVDLIENPKISGKNSSNQPPIITINKGVDARL